MELNKIKHLKKSVDLDFNFNLIIQNYTHKKNELELWVRNLNLGVPSTRYNLIKRIIIF